MRRREKGEADRKKGAIDGSLATEQDKNENEERTNENILPTADQHQVTAATNNKNDDVTRQ